MVGLRQWENKGSNVRYNKINITFPDMVIVENIIPRNMIINLGCASVDNHIPRDDIFDYHHIREAAEVDNHISRDDIFDYHHIREGNIYIISRGGTGGQDPPPPRKLQIYRVS